MPIVLTPTPPAAFLQHDVFIDFSGNEAFETRETSFTDDGRVARGLGLPGVAIVTPDVGEDVSLAVLGDRIIADRGRNAIAGLLPPFANEMVFATRNTDGRYTPTNAGSDLYPNVVLGRTARWRLTHNAIVYPLGQGKLTGITPHTRIGTETVDFVALSQLARLVGLTGRSSALYGDGTLVNGIRSDQALALVFAAGGMTDPAMFAFDVGETILLWFHIRPELELFDLAIRIWASEGPGAQLFDRADGVTEFRRRSAFQTDTRSNSPQATFRDVDDGASAWYVDWERGDGEAHVVNAALMTHVRRAVDAADSALWRFGASMTFGNDEARTFQVAPQNQLGLPPSTDEPIASVVAPALGTDYTVTAGAVVSIAFDRTSGPFLTMTVTAGPAGATVAGPTATPTDGFTVRGTLARVTVQTPVSDQGVDTAASIAQYGPKALPFQLLGELDYAVAQSLMNGFVRRGLAARATSTFEVAIFDDVLALAALPLEVGDRVTVQNDRDAFSQSMWIDAVRVAVENGARPRVRFACESVYSTSYGLWDVSLWGGNTFTDDGSVARGLGLAGVSHGVSKWGV